MKKKLDNINDLNIDETGVIKKLTSTGNLRRRMLDLGLVNRYENNSIIY